MTQGARTGARKVEDAFYDNPLITGVITLALGLAAGLTAPSTHHEVVLMGETRDQLGDSVRNVVQATKHKAEHIAERVIAATKSAASDEGLVAT